MGATPGRGPASVAGGQPAAGAVPQQVARPRSGVPQARRSEAETGDSTPKQGEAAQHGKELRAAERPSALEAERRKGGAGGGLPRRNGCGDCTVFMAIPSAARNRRLLRYTCASQYRATPMQSTIEIGNENDIDGLTFIHRFGWLRPTELGRLLWPESASQRKNATKLVAKWRKKKCVIERKLPENFGTALVLASAGVRVLADAGITAKTGKNWGDAVDGGWTAPATWRHQLLQTGVAALYLAGGYEIRTEPEIRRFGTDLDTDSYPDLLIRAPDANDWAWVEVERARKTGRVRRRMGYQDKLGARHKLAATLRSAALGLGFGPFNVRGAVVAFDADGVDERGYRSGHEARVARALTETRGAQPLVTIGFLGLKLAGGTILDTRYEQKTV